MRLVSVALPIKAFIPNFVGTATTQPTYPAFSAINYRLSPQYPFPCAIQDALAAYLYLIRPPPEAKHKPVKPQHIVIIGDSAGGGLSLALLQVIRDSGLPQCAGGVLISPWCDMSHSFPSIHTNTATVGPHTRESLTNTALSLFYRISYLFTVCRCTNPASYGHLLRAQNPIQSVRSSDLVSSELPKTKTG